MKAGQLVSVMLNVTDIGSSKQFFGELLGLPLIAEFDDHIAVHSAGVSTVVLHAHEGNAVRAAPAGLDDASAVPLYFTVDDVDGFVEVLRGQGVTVAQEPADQPWGVHDACVLDPDGHPTYLTMPLDS